MKYLYRKVKDIIEYIKRIIWRIKDYERLEDNYLKLLSHATGGRMSYTTYNPYTVNQVVDEAMQDLFYGIMADDIDSMETLEEVKEYIKPHLSSNIE